MLKHCAIQQVFQAGLVVAVQVSEFEHLIGRRAKHIGMPLECNFVLCQSACFVGTQNVHGTKVLYRIEPFNNHFFARQDHRTFGQGRRHDHRQHFGG